MEEDKDTSLLARAAANHLHLGQFEPFRATLLSLRLRNPSLSLAFLQTLVSLSGRLQNHNNNNNNNNNNDNNNKSNNILWSTPSLLAYLSALELFQYNPHDAVSSLWPFDSNSLRLRVEFSLFLETLTSKSKESEPESLLVLGKLAELGFRRLRPDSVGRVKVSSEELMGLRRVMLENALLFDVLCENISNQVIDERENDSGLAVALRREGEGERSLEEEDEKVLRLVQRSVQMVHLDAMRECLGKRDEEGAASHVRFLHMGYGVEEAEYRYGFVLHS